MQDIKIRGVDKNIVKALDEIVDKEKYPSRNTLLLEIIEMYISSRSSFFLKALPPTIHYVAKDCLINQSEKAEDLAKSTCEINIQILKKLNEIASIFDVE